MSTSFDESSWPADGEIPVLGTALYGLVPIGTGAPQCESLRGYLVRLACEHQVSPRDLVSRVLALSSRPIAGWNYARFYSLHAATVDGLGRYAQTFTDALQEATGRSDLTQTTLLPLARLLAPNGQKLLSGRPRWCPQCLACDTLEHGGGHWQLRWSIASISRCADHRCSLVDRCPSCGRVQPAIPRSPTLHHCDHCGALLASNEAVPGAEDHEDVTAAVVDDLVAMLGRVPAAPQLAWQRALNRAVAATPEGQRAALCKRLGLQPRGLNGWLQKQKRVSLESLVRVCTAFATTPSVLLAGDGTPKPSALKLEQPLPALRHGARTRDKAKRSLRAALAAGSPPPLRSVADRAGVSRGYLKYWFKDLAGKLTSTRKDLRLRAREQRNVQRIEVIRKTVEAAIEVGVFPGRKLVEAAARLAGFSLMDDDMISEYATILKEFGRK